jgi:hypothetical protein
VRSIFVLLAVQLCSDNRLDGVCKGVKSFFKFCYDAGIIPANPPSQLSIMQVKADEASDVRPFEPKIQNRITCIKGPSQAVTVDGQYAGVNGTLAMLIFCGA